MRRPAIELDVRHGGGDALPRLDDITGSDPGRGQSVRELEATDTCAEAEMLRDGRGRGAPCSVFCFSWRLLGGQMLRAALGAEVRRMPRRLIAGKSQAPVQRPTAIPCFQAWPAGRGRAMARGPVRPPAGGVG